MRTLGVVADLYRLTRASHTLPDGNVGASTEGMNVFTLLFQYLTVPRCSHDEIHILDAHVRCVSLDDATEHDAPDVLMEVEIYVGFLPFPYLLIRHTPEYL
jgi:hypothetical protein